jgi:hypothetical protein
MGGGPTSARSEPAMNILLHATRQWSRVAVPSVERGACGALAMCKT